MQRARESEREQGETLMLKHKTIFPVRISISLCIPRTHFHRSCTGWWLLHCTVVLILFPQ